jgi:hypothetical protein
MNWNVAKRKSALWPAHKEDIVTTAGTLGSVAADPSVMCFPVTKCSRI